MLMPLLGLSARNKKWLADRLYESVAADAVRDKEEAIVLSDIREGLLDIKEGRTIPAEDLFEFIDND